MSIGLQYQSSFYKPKTYKDMEETLFKLTRAITDTGTDTVSSKGGTVTYRITSLKRKLVNGKVASTSTPSCTLGSASVSWATWGGVTVGDGYLDVKINYSENTGSSRSTTLTFTQNGSNNKINLTVTQGSGVTYSGYIKMVSNTLPLGGNKDNTAQILVMAYLNGSDGSKKPETPHVGSAPDWCSVSVSKEIGENYYMLSLTALSNNNTGANLSGHIFLTCGDANLSIPVTQTTAKKITANITISVFKSPNSNTQGLCDIRSNQLVASDITFRLQIQYGVSSGDVREYIYTLAKGSAISRNNTFAIQNGANPQVVDYGYSPQEDSKYIYSVSVI